MDDALWEYFPRRSRKLRQNLKPIVGRKYQKLIKSTSLITWIQRNVKHIRNVRYNKCSVLITQYQRARFSQRNVILLVFDEVRRNADCVYTRPHDYSEPSEELGANRKSSIGCWYKETVSRCYCQYRYTFWEYARAGSAFSSVKIAWLREPYGKHSSNRRTSCKFT